MPKKRNTRSERDSMGEMQVPATAYYGASTQRAVLNFPISELRLPRSFIRALALIKWGAAQINFEDGHLSKPVADAIKRAALEVARGKYDKHFVVDVFQTGSGTSTNMNANEVIANRAIEILGGKRGDRKLVHPNDDVNRGMSSNDAIPTAIHIAALLEISESLVPALFALQVSLQGKAAQFMPVLKTGRTHLQDATPIRLGQEFTGYAGQVERALERLVHAQERLSQVALGGTAVGTGVNTSSDFAARVLQAIRTKVAIDVRETSNHFQAQSTLDEVVECSGTLKTIAVSLMKVANDIRWLGSGPRAGLGEIMLPEVQPGSSIMPGKVNPVIAESVCMVAAQVIGNDATIAVAGQSGNFELNVMMPVAAYNLLQSISLLAASATNFRSQCIDGLQATKRGPQSVEQGLALCTSLVPAIGYDAAAAISHEAAETGESIRQVATRRTKLTVAELDRLLDAATMTTAGPTAALQAQLKRGRKTRVIGVTGGIATGKSAVGKKAEAMGVVVIDADDLSHELTDSPSAAYDAVLARFGKDLVEQEGGPINRKKLGKIVFADKQALLDLNAIMHPAIDKLLDERIASHADRDIVAVLMPLIFENRLEEKFDEIWVVTLDRQVQRERLKARYKAATQMELSDEEADARIDAQLPQSVKVAGATRLIDNGGTLEATGQQVEACLMAARAA